MVKERRECAWKTHSNLQNAVKCSGLALRGKSSSQTPHYLLLLGLINTNHKCCGAGWCGGWGVVPSALIHSFVWLHNTPSLVKFSPFPTCFCYSNHVLWFRNQTALAHHIQLKHTTCEPPDQMQCTSYLLRPVRILTDTHCFCRSFIDTHKITMATLTLTLVCGNPLQTNTMPRDRQYPEKKQLLRGVQRGKMPQYICTSEKRCLCLPQLQ